jgi:hypothetical protein
MTPAMVAKIRRENIRWMILDTANMHRPGGMNTDALLPIIRSVYHNVTDHEIRLELDYLEERELVKIAKDPLDNWFVDLKRYGIEVAQYECECDPGIARPTITRG